MSRSLQTGVYFPLTASGAGFARTHHPLIKVVAAALVLTLAARAAADPAPTAPPIAHLHTPRLACHVPPATPDCLTLSPGYYLDEPSWSALDIETRRLQDVDTRLTSENVSLRHSAAAWSPGWRTLLGALVVGVAGGVYVRGRI